MHLVDDQKMAIWTQAKLVLGVSENEASVGGNGLAPGEDRERNGLNFFPQRWFDQATLEDLV